MWFFLGGGVVALLGVLVALLDDAWERRCLKRLESNPHRANQIRRQRWRR